MKCPFKMKMKSCWYNNVENYGFGAWLGEKKKIILEEAPVTAQLIFKTAPSFPKDSFPQGLHPADVFC